MFKVYDLFPALVQMSRRKYKLYYITKVENGMPERKLKISIRSRCHLFSN